MGGLIVRATRLFFATLPFLAATTLAVYLPLKGALQMICYAFDIPLEGILAYCLMDAADLVVSALVIPAVVYGLVTRLRTGRTPAMSEALRWGRRQWSRTLWNKFKVEITIAIWSLLLVIPGVVAMIRLIFTDVVVGVEGDDEREPLARSRALSTGHGWRILLALLPAAPLSAAHMYATLRMVQIAPVAMVPVDALFSVLDQWMNVAILLVYLGLAVGLKPAVAKGKVA